MNACSLWNTLHFHDCPSWLSTQTIDQVSEPARNRPAPNMYNFPALMTQDYWPADVEPTILGLASPNPLTLMSPVIPRC
jgi:hypothetical protein